MVLMIMVGIVSIMYLIEVVIESFWVFCVVLYDNICWKQVCYGIFLNICKSN